MRLQKGLLLLFAGILFTRIHIASAESDAQFNTASVPPVPDRRLRKHNFELAKEGSDTEERGLNAEAAAKAFAIDAKKIDDVASKMEIEMANVKYNWLKYLAHQKLRDFEGHSSQVAKNVAKYFSEWKASGYGATNVREEMVAAGITDEAAIQNAQKWFAIFAKKCRVVAQDF
ncbi:hypothetical protein PPTG_09774 [Phytophthora nicotianae INRA-310]|uniref:RxLR effector protein n=2 Tax=Phytophthora nicotianae TaxID=4792 RepID=W2QDQ5_PHYN3|nr:hypothetical protein PPTG_09774 [Phytophthora nicotianae INRA-310]ETN10669.1 hypothetical protein PPTG_09774 [Phytophthora nicotianae INRA-310]